MAAPAETGAVTAVETPRGFRFYPKSLPLRMKAIAPPRILTGTRVEKHGTITVNGHVLKPGADLRKVKNLAGTDLRWVNLRHADLQDCDLRGCDLSGADLSFAWLQGADLTGAILDGTKLMQAKLFEAVGADLRRAQLHPFFSKDEPEKIGAIRLLVRNQPGGVAEAVRDLVVGPTGNLFWLQGERGKLITFSRTGASFEPLGALDKPLHTLVKDASNRLWMFGAKHLLFLDLNKAESPRTTAAVPFLGVSVKDLPTRPRMAAATHSGTVLVSEAGRLREFGIINGCYSSRYWNLPLTDFSADLLTCHGQANQVFCVDKFNERVVSLSDNDKTFPAPLKCVHDPLGMAIAKDGSAWISMAGENRIHIQAPLSVQKPKVLDLPPGVLPNQLAKGPDDNIWATGAAEIYRITPEGEVTTFPLPRNIQPISLQDGGGGKMLFVTRSGQIGSIRALASPGKVLPGLAFSAAPSQPVETRRNRAEATPEAASTLPPFLRLYDLFVNLTPKRTRHILAEHSGGVTWKSAFNADHNTEGTVQELVARCVEKAKADGTFARVKVTDAEGCFYTFCTHPHPVGSYQRFGKKIATHRYVVLTTRNYDHASGEWVHDVKTAYPVSPNW